MEQILELKDINKSFAGIQVLHNVNLTLHAGETVCLVGENGAGKSTLIKILSGAEKPDSGSITLFGRTWSSLQPSQAMELGVATIYQDVDLVDTLSVADNIFQGAEIRKNGIFIDRRKQEEKAGEILRALNMTIRPDVLVETLSPGQKQNLQIAKALHKKAKILIMDEPTASLGEDETKALMELIDRLKHDGIGIIYISHYMDEIFRVGDRVNVLKDGYSVSERQIGEVTQETLIREMVGRDASNYYRKGNFSTGDQALEIRGYTRGNLVKNVSFTVSHGEVLGLGGLVGAGRTELVRMLFGADRKESGQMFLNGKEITPKDPKDAIKKGICFVSEDRKGEALFLDRSVKENISIAKNESSFFLNLAKEKELVDHSIEQLSIKVFNREHDAGKLSGGNQQKVVISRWLAMDGEIYIFDEPSKGVDVGAREEIYRLIEELVKRKKIVIMVSSTMPELISMSDRIAVMKDGALSAVIPADEAQEDELLKWYMGIK